MKTTVRISGNTKPLRRALVPAWDRAREGRCQVSAVPDIDSRRITVGGAQHYRVTGITADMSWLGDPPTAEESARYEQVRDGRCAAALLTERSRLEYESRQLLIDISASESPVRRQRLVERLQRVQSDISRIEHGKGGAK